MSQSLCDFLLYPSKRLFENEAFSAALTYIEKSSASLKYFWQIDSIQVSNRMIGTIQEYKWEFFISNCETKGRLFVIRHEETFPKEYSMGVLHCMFLFD